MTRKSKKQYILESAANIVNRQGTDYLTLDAVARSKYKQGWFALSC